MVLLMWVWILVSGSYSSCLVPQCPYPSYWPHHQRRLANCDWVPASYTSWQPSNPRRYPTCWASLQWSHTISRTPCHGAWTSAPLSAHPCIECCCSAPIIETPVCTRRTATHQLLWKQQHTWAHWAHHEWNAEWAYNPTRLCTLIPDTGTHPPEWPSKKSLGPA